MSEAQVKPLERQRLSFGLDDEEIITKPALPISRASTTEKVEAVSEQSGFVTRSPKAQAARKTAVEAPIGRMARKRALTGRTMPFNTKLRPECYQEICDFSEQFSDTEGRPVGMAEVIERALDALKAKLKG